MSELPGRPSDGFPESAIPVRVAVDVVALTVLENELMILLATRLIPPYEGQRCLPGGFILAGETLEQAALRELREETGLDATGHLEQLRTFGPENRDPRGPVLSVAYLALTPFDSAPRPGGDVSGAEWVPVRDCGGLAFDHDTIVATGVERARAKLEYSGLATAFCGEEFTIPDLKAIYEAVWGVRLDPRNFHRKIIGTGHFLEPVATRQGATGRPATVYRMAADCDPATFVLNPPVMRPTTIA